MSEKRINKKDLCHCGRKKDVRSKQCSYCFYHRPIKKYYCKCGNEIIKTTKHCWRCHTKSIIGKNNPNANNKWTKKQKELQGIITKKAMDRPEIINKMKKNHYDCSGENNSNWQGGIDTDPYPLEFNDTLKEQIRKRDNYECQNCSITEEEHLIVCGRILHIHHIDYDKQNCNEGNLITLCMSCNIRANYNRTYWKEIYLEKTKCQKNV